QDAGLGSDLDRGARPPEQVGDHLGRDPSGSGDARLGGARPNQAGDVLARGRGRHHARALASLTVQAPLLEVEVALALAHAATPARSRASAARASGSRPPNTPYRVLPDWRPSLRMAISRHSALRSRGQPAHRARARS